ncbi:hypothetical protein ACHMXB_13900 [Arthrobacter sp. UC242_113]|uniref:hypothetical protein n=1 Tax=Arthrobacter sp. UC242_113 TaxID=3374550 RepID=UPI003756BBC6
MDANTATPGEPDRLDVASERGRCSEDAADELDDFCSESLRSIDKTVMRAQVIELILDILATTDVESEARQRLLQHLALHPGSPEQALLCHLSENACLPPAAGGDSLLAGGSLPAGGDYFTAGAEDRPSQAAGSRLKDRSRGGSPPLCGTCCAATELDRRE